MLIKKVSAISGKINSKEIPVNPDDWVMYNMGYASIDDAMPYLTQEDKEFILSGILQDEWNNISKLVNGDNKL